MPRISGSFSAENCVKLVETKLQEFEIITEKHIVACVTDGASMMVKFGKIMSYLVENTVEVEDKSHEEEDDGESEELVEDLDKALDLEFESGGENAKQLQLLAIFRDCLVKIVWLDNPKRTGTRLFCEEEESISNSSHSEEESIEILEEKPLTLDEKLEKAIYSKIKVLYCSTKKSTSFNQIMKQEMQLFDSTENPSPNIIKLCDALKTNPPTSVETERAFSAAGLFVTKLRTRLSDKKRNAINIVQFSDKSTEDFPVICYTDGGKIDGRVGFAFVVFRSGVESQNFQFRIRDECTVFVAELLCLNFAIKWITEQNSVISEYLICTDSLSSLDSLKCISTSNNINVEIQKKQLKILRDKNISIYFAFVRGHTGVLGNERANWLAKAATKRKIDIDVNIPKSFYKKITKERTVKSWNQECLISNKGSITKKFFPTINKRLSCHHFYTNYKLTQFLSGHGNFKSYLNKFNLVPSSFCDCNIGGEENVEHVILLCSKYVRERKIIRLAFKRLNINWPPNFHQLLSTRSAFKNFCKFVVTVCNPS
ncbi:uncharacterized protein TNCV_1496811 [Trichonephila clavipes]|nr:uncharacterized protein TNCV_1496811 [Trichonephila clavipes]